MGSARAATSTSAASWPSSCWWSWPRCCAGGPRRRRSGRPCPRRGSCSPRRNLNAARSAPRVSSLSARGRDEPVRVRQRERSAARAGRLRRRSLGRQLGISSGELEVIMKRLLLAGLVLIVLVSPALAAEQTVSYKSGDETVSGLLVTPDGKGPFPAVVVIHEWWGLDDWVKDQARALAKEGYVALAVDLYRGKVTKSQEEAHQFMMGLPQERALRDLKGAYAALASAPGARKD